MLSLDPPDASHVLTTALCELDLGPMCSPRRPFPTGADGARFGTGLHPAAEPRLRPLLWRGAAAQDGAVAARGQVINADDLSDGLSL